MRLAPPPTDSATAPAEVPTEVPAGARRAVARAIGELRRGDPVLLHAPGGRAALVLAAEQASEPALARLARLAGAAARLILTARRARALGLEVPGGPEAGGAALRLAGVDARTIVELADPTSGGPDFAGAGLSSERVPEPLGPAAVDLVKLARLLPAALFAPAPLRGAGPGAWAAGRDVLPVALADLASYRAAATQTLARVAEARLPLAGAEDTRVVAFRPGDGGRPHLALIIGAPRSRDSVLVRLHSECLTGDLLGSLRCDCGDQLRGAIETIAGAGAGVLLYLSQEGRGIGLVNKLRAYRLQDRGADTAQANEALGFDADERIYRPAAQMLRQLGVARVRLLTNNPHKVAGLTRCAIAVEERVPHAFPSNGHNAFYLATKAARFGHEF